MVPNRVGRVQEIKERVLLPAESVVDVYDVGKLTAAFASGYFYTGRRSLFLWNGLCHYLTTAS